MLDILPSLLAFSLAMALTPGPNNVMVTASAATFGFRRTVPHMLGITVGFPAMTVAVGLGLGTVFTTYPVIHVVLKWVGAAYLCWLAWLVATASRPEAGEAGAGPFGFWRAALFQWVNPKAWAMALTAVTVYAPDRSLWAVALVAVIFGAINLPSVSLWTLIGQQLRRVLTNTRRLTIFNWTMAGLLILSLAPVLWH